MTKKSTESEVGEGTPAELLASYVAAILRQNPHKTYRGLSKLAGQYVSPAVIREAKALIAKDEAPPAEPTGRDKVLALLTRKPLASVAEIRAAAGSLLSSTAIKSCARQVSGDLVRMRSRHFRLQLERARHGMSGAKEPALTSDMVMAALREMGSGQVGGIQSTHITVHLNKAYAGDGPGFHMITVGKCLRNLVRDGKAMLYRIKGNNTYRLKGTAMSTSRKISQAILQRGLMVPQELNDLRPLLLKALSGTLAKKGGGLAASQIVPMLEDQDGGLFNSRTVGRCLTHMEREGVVLKSLRHGAGFYSLSEQGREAAASKPLFPEPATTTVQQVAEAPQAITEHTVRSLMAINPKISRMHLPHALGRLVSLDEMKTARKLNVSARYVERSVARNAQSTPSIRQTVAVSSGVLDAATFAMVQRLVSQLSDFTKLPLTVECISHPNPELRIVVAPQ